MTNAVEKWLNKLNEIKNAYPFGPLQEFRDEEGRLHRMGGPAYISPVRIIYYEVGRKHGIDVDIFGSMTFYFRGVAVPSDFVISPEKLTLDKILKQKNTEVRRVGMEIYGFERMISEGRAQLIHKDESRPAELYHISIKKEDEKNIAFVNDPLALVRVLDGTPDESGHRRVFFLKVPPSSKTCQEAIAWTFRRSENEYYPEIER